MQTDIELEPLCFKKEIAMAVTNRGHLIPCCRCDNPANMADPEFQKLLKVSKISDYNSINEILETDEWNNFRKDLRNNKGPASCVYTCRKNKPEEEVQILKKLNTETQKLTQNQRR